MQNDDVTTEDAPRTPTWVWALGLAAGAYIVYLLVVSLAAADDPQGAGYVIGFIIGAFVIALIARFVYVKLRSGTGPFLSPWIVVIAAVIVLISRLANAGGS